ncbi:MAG: bifunctional alpha,alpha-trehalose-phosphate synthase (UDP-forming)/trehalose-phosphatase [Deltaproteobacteria bacterium]|nr:bifunctional alpha,alpha-trehalose-phosphate synthase (UDP-forming)/trehalose-phosphatase [Deltaproteobacteria bacterium]
MPRLLIVSNRLPVTVKVDQGEVSLARSAGGLATAMRGPHERLDALWIGWPGDVSRLTDAQRHAADERLAAERTAPVHLSQAQVARYYDGFSNAVLWPLFHYLADKVELDARRDWEVYAEVNDRFARAVVERWRPGDFIWVHDYQLMLLPQMLRERLPDARIGFFLHIPFPSSELFRILPWREQILRGMLGADLVGFHTASFRHNFANSAARVLGVEPEVDVVQHEGRAVRLGVHPIGIDVAEFARLANDPGVLAHAQQIRRETGGRTLVLGVDRFDYTKGLPRRMLALERLFERGPHLRKKVRLVQLAVPTRERVDAYAELRRHVNELVGRINAQYGSVGGVPIHLLHRSVPPDYVVALYLAADVMMVTPLRDGMNLVAKEFVASRVDGAGALVLSEFAGAADELSDALLVNPYDIDSVASTLQRAILMSPAEQHARMRALRAQVEANDVHAWARRFLDDLALEDPRRPRPSLASAPAKLADEIAASQYLELLLDYDGTLMPLARTPDQAQPDDALRALLRALAERPRTRVNLVSGRKRDNMDAFFGELPIAMHAEHGFWFKPRGGAWAAAGDANPPWKDEARAIMDRLAARTGGAFVEEKAVSLAWHYRRVDAELASVRLRELRYLLRDLADVHRLEVLSGSKVLELRPAGVNKGLAVARARADAPPGARLVAIGDDRTDEDLFTALPEGSIAIHVGRGDTIARYRLESPEEVRALLEALVHGS